MLTRPGPDGITLWQSPAPVGYDDAINQMEAHIAGIQTGTHGEALWFLEHEPVYTGGSSARPEELLIDPSTPDAPIIRSTGRGGQWTYHAPGQRIVYIMLDLRQRGRDVRAFVRGIEAWVIMALADLGITAGQLHGAPGVWVDHTAPASHKIAAIGVRLTRWISWHGVAINVDKDMLAGFSGIVPCGIAEAGVTAITAETTSSPEMAFPQLDAALTTHFADTLGDYMRFSGV